MLYIKKGLFASLLLIVSGALFAHTIRTASIDVHTAASALTVYSNSEGAVQYTVTNNTTTDLPDAQIDLNPSQTQGINLSLYNDQCSSKTLAPGKSCTFTIIIPGTNQSEHFTMQPKACFFAHQLCRLPSTPFSVTVAERTLPTRTYQVGFTGYKSTEDLVGINTANLNDVIHASIADPEMDGPLAIAPDGTKVYVLHQTPQYHYEVLVSTQSRNVTFSPK